VSSGTPDTNQSKIKGEIEMNKRKVWFLILCGIILFIAGGFVGWLDMSSLLPWQSGNLYEDPQGRFTMKIDPSWEQVKTDGSYGAYRMPNPPMHMYLLAFKASTIDDAYSQALQILGFDQGILIGGGKTSLGDWQAYGKEDATGLTTGLAGQIVGDNAYIMVVKGDKPGIVAENPATLRALKSIKILGQKKVAIESYAGLEALVRQQVDRLAGSVSVSVVHQEKIVYTYAYGKANPLNGVAADTQTIYHFGSMTKPVTATALMQLVEQGKVDLDAWPGKYIPEYPKRWNVTVRQLLDHSACMPDDPLMTDGLIARRGETLPSLADVFTRYIKENPELTCDPGKASQYANSHYLALGLIIEKVSGESYETYVVDHILTPLEMKSTSFQLVEATDRYAKPQYPTDQTPDLLAKLTAFRGPGQENLILGKSGGFSTTDDFSILPPWGGLFGTPSDITHFLQMYLNNGRYGDVQILKPETVAAMEKMQKSTDGSPLGLGLSWWIDKDDFGTYYYHNGGGVGIDTKMRYYPDLDVGVVVMGSVEGYQSANIAEGLVSAWMHK
jgi:CubicO group peptidase (beta-lactamase class C family)